jgi:hypothetical protein
MTVQGNILNSESFSVSVSAAEGPVGPLPNKIPGSQEPKYTL